MMAEEHDGSDLFADTRRDMANGTLPNDRLASPFVELFPVSGTAVSAMGSLLASETIAATDARAARLDELQFDLGEGPCWDALRWRRPVFEPDVRSHPPQRWTAFSEAIVEHEVGALFAFPMLVGPLQVGAIDMYADQPTALDRMQARQASALADVLARRILRQSIDTASAPNDTDGNPLSRRTIHQATGMVLAQLSISAYDALLVLQSHAFATERTMMDVAQDVLDHRLDFSALEGDAGSRS